VAVVLLVRCAAPHSEESPNHVASRSIDEALAAHTDGLLRHPGVVGTAVGLCDGVPCIRVFVSDAAARAGIPDTLDGHPIRVEVTGPLRPRGGTP